VSQLFFLVVLYIILNHFSNFNYVLIFHTFKMPLWTFFKSYFAAWSAR